MRKTQKARPRKSECTQLAKVLRAVNLTRPVDADLVKHARKCGGCLFWLSYLLAKRKTYFLTSRLCYEDCPQREMFSYALLTLIRNMEIERVGYANKAIQRFKTEIEPELLDPLREHLEECPSCAEYYQDMCEIKTCAK